MFLRITVDLHYRKKWHNMSIKTKSPEKEDLPERHNTEPSDSSSVGNIFKTFPKTF